METNIVIVTYDMAASFLNKKFKRTLTQDEILNHLLGEGYLKLSKEILEKNSPKPN